MNFHDDLHPPDPNQCQNCKNFSIPKGGRGLQIFAGLVLGCIDADFCIQILIFQHFLRSTRFAILRTAQISNFHEEIGNFFRVFGHLFVKISYFSLFLIEFCTDFDEIFSEFRQNFVENVLNIQHS